LNVKKEWEKEREREKGRKEREKVGPRRRSDIEKDAFHLALATFTDIICLCLTFDKQQEWNNFQELRVSSGTQPKIEVWHDG